MLKFLANSYYWMLAILIVYFIFNIAVREPLVESIYNIDPYESVTNADAYQHFTQLRNLFINLFWGYLAFVSIVSIILLIVPEGKNLSKWFLILTPITALLLFLFVLMVGGFSRGWY